MSTLVRALALALTGEDVGDGPDDLDTALEAIGWDADRVRDHATGCRTRQIPWPHPLPAGLVLGSSAGRFAAHLLQVRADWSLDPAPLDRPKAGPPTARDRELSADRPPHW